MKKLFVFLMVLVAAMLTLFLSGEKNNKQSRVAFVPEGTRDEEMAGPRGEEIFIGSGGGRYFIKNGKKIYVGYRGKKQHYHQSV